MPLLLEARRLGGFIQKYHLRWRWHHLYLWPIILCWKTIKLLKLKVFWLLFSFLLLDPRVSSWVNEWRLRNLTDVTLADEDTNSILADNAKGAIQGNEAMEVMQTYASGAIWWPNLQLMQVAPSGGQICNLCKWCHLVAKFATYASGAIWWPNLLLMQVVPTHGQICYY